MPRLTRVHQKVFASNAANNGVFGSLQAGNPQTSNDVATLQSLSAFENGWNDAIEQGDKLPPLEEFQGIQYGISYQQAYMLQEGIAEWDASTPYYKGSLVKTISGSSFKLYCSLSDNNTGNIVTNTTYWKLVMDSDEGYFILSDNNSATGNNTFSGNNSFTGTNTFVHPYVQSGSITKGTAPAENTYMGLYFADKNGTNFASNQMGQLQLNIGSDGSSSMRISAIKPESGSTEQVYFGVGYNSSGEQFVNASNDVRQGITIWGMPNYSGRQSRNANTQYTADSNGYLYIWGKNTSTLTIDGVSFSVGGRGGSYESYDTSVWPMQKGTVYKTPNLESQTCYFIPCYGV